MNGKTARSGAVCVAAILFAQPGLAQAVEPGSARTRHAVVTLLSEVNAVAPGQPFDIGLSFKLDAGWHIYWKNGGDAGLPPKVSWTLPDGFDLSPLRFPVPKRYLDKGGLTSFIHEGEPMLLATVTPPASLPDSSVVLKAGGKYLICQETCIWEPIDATLTLPALEPGAKPAPANQERFAAARRALPRSSSKFVSIHPTVASSPPKPDARGDLVLGVRVAKGLHIQSNTPLSESLIKCDLFLEPSPGVYFDPPQFPKPQIRRVKVVGKLSEYSGDVTIRVPFETDEELPAEPVRFAGVFRYQACNEEGSCFPPEALEWSLTAGEGAVQAPAGRGQVSTGEGGPGPSIDVVAELPPPEVQNQPALEGGFEATLLRWGLPGLLIGCFLYGLFINATPCVLPLLSIKVLGFVQQAHESHRRTFALGLTFSIGVLIFFVVLGFLAAAGKNILQFPVAVIALGALVTALALSMLGVYTLQVPTAASRLDATLQREGLLTSFGKGALAPVLGFACTGPLLAGMFGLAAKQEPRVAMLAFLSTGLGMASPYLVMGANPHWLRFLPKPGQWMVTFERIMGFLLLAMVVWLMHPLVVQLGPAGLEWTFVFFISIALACWVWGRIDINMSTARRWRFRLGSTTIVAVSGWLIYGWVLAAPSGSIEWRAWSREAVAAAVKAGKTVLVDFTAAYCTNCKVNKKVAIEKAQTVAKMKDYDVVAFQGDFTDGNPEIFEELQKFDRSGVPLDLIYAACEPAEPIVLRPQLTLPYLLDKLDEAGPSRPCATTASAVTPSG